MKSVAAIAAGFLTTALLSVGADAVMHATGIVTALPSVWVGGILRSR